MAKLVKTILHAVCRHKIAATQETDSKNLLLKSIKETEAVLSLSIPFSLFPTVLDCFWTGLLKSFLYIFNAMRGETATATG